MSQKKINSIGVLGAGKLGIVLSQLALKAGYSVYVAGSGDASSIGLTVDTLAPGAIATSARDAAIQSDIVILAMPLSKYRNVPKEALAGKIVIDAMNHWYEVDGPRSDTIPDHKSSSYVVQSYLADSTVVKAFNHMGYHDLYDETRPAGKLGRKSIAVAGDDKGAVEIVSYIIDDLGFDPLPIGDLVSGEKLEPGQPAFGADLEADRLRKLIV